MGKLKLGFIGYGQRGVGLLGVTLNMDDVDVVAVCDEYEDRAEAAKKKVEEKREYTPFSTTDYREILKREDVEAVVIATSWEAHVEVAIAAMKAGKYVGVEVGGAYSIEDCWRLVHTSEETGMPCMMLENCCYGKKELMCLNMVKNGDFGELVHCNGAYHHDLRNEVSSGNEIRHYRLRNYTHRNCDNYPTHALGPIAKLLNINRGNRFLSLVSMSSKARGLHEYIVNKRGKEDDLAKIDFKQGDVVTTVIKCAGGETIRLTLSITLPRAYSRDFDISGTKAYYQEETNSLYLDRDEATYEKEYGEVVAKSLWNNVETTYGKEFNHPIWKKYEEEGIKGGHGGMDWLVLRAFYESAMAKADPPIDVYDTAAWMSISTLTEDSLAMGGIPVAVPDFTNGKWIKNKDRKRNEIPTYSLAEIPETVELKG
ncbi:MAG: Gfo/Idh/MocA family oxidoreductase [Clostridia bacterium]|nr:Gfo/Idh/MocA family oxidoreductase [Clostridia bacterium]